MSMIPTTPAAPGGIGNPPPNPPIPAGDLKRSVVAAKVNPDNTSQAQILFGSGEIRGVNSVSSSRTFDTYKDFWGGNPSRTNAPTEIAVDFSVVTWSPRPSGFVISSEGRIMPFGDATVPQGALLFGTGNMGPRDAKAVGLHMESYTGGVWVDSRGYVEAFGDVAQPSADMTEPERAAAGFTDKSCVDFSYDPVGNRWLVLSSTGQIKASPGATSVSQGCNAFARIGNARTAVGINYDWERQRGYVIDSRGTTYPIGAALDLPADPFWATPGNATAMAVASWGEDSVFTYWVFDSVGGSYYRVFSTPPRVSIVAPAGLPLIQRLTATGTGLFRLRRETDPLDAGATTLTTEQIVYTSSLDKLAEELDRLIGADSYSMAPYTGYEDGDPLDVLITLPGGNLDALEVTGDSAGGVALTVTQAGTNAVITDTSRPTVSWTYVDAEDDPQGAWEVSVWPHSPGLAAVPPPTTSQSVPAWYSTGESRNQRSVRISSPLTDDTTYRVYVRVQEGGGRWSEWDYTDFSLDLVTPVAPTTTLTADPEQAAVKISLGDVSVPERSNLIWLERRSTGGTSWEMVRGSGRTITTGLFDNFERPDSDTLGEPWKVSGTALRLKDEAVEPYVAATGRKPQLGKLVTLGRPTNASLLGELDLGGTVLDWNDPGVAPANGGNLFRDQFTSLSMSEIPTALDGTAWVIPQGKFASNGTGAYRTQSNTAAGGGFSIAAIDTGGRIGVVSVEIDLAPGAAGPVTRADYGKMGVIMAADANGVGHVFYGEINVSGDMDFFYGRTTPGGAIVGLTSWTGVITEPWDKHRMTVNFGAGAVMSFEVRNATGDVLYTGSHTPATAQDINGQFFGLFGGLAPGIGGGTPFKTNLVQWQDFRWARPSNLYTLPGTKEQAGAWFSTSNGTTSPMMETSTDHLTIETAPDTAMSVKAGGSDFVGTIEFRRSATDGVKLSTFSNQMALLSGTNKMALVEGDPDHASIALAPEEELRVEVSGDNVQILVNGEPRKLTPWVATHPALSSADWNAVSNCDPPGDWLGEVTLVATANGTVIAESDSQAVATAAAGWSASGYLDLKGVNGTFAQAYISCLDGGGSVIRILMGPKRPMVGGGSIDRARVSGVLPTGTANIRYGIIFTGATAADEFKINATGRAELDTIAIPSSYRLGTKWKFHGGRNVSWKAPSFKPLATHSVRADDVSANGAELSNHPAGGRAASAANVPILSSRDGVVAHWGLATDDVDDLKAAVDAALTWTRCRHRAWFIDTYTYVLGTWAAGPGTTIASVDQRIRDAQGAAFEPSGRVLSSATGFSAISISVPTVRAGEVLAVGVTLTHAGDGFNYKRAGDAGWTAATDAFGEPLSNRSIGDGHYATSAVAHIPLNVTGSAQTVEFQMGGTGGGGVTFDWWGIESVTAAPLTALVGVPVEDPAGVEVARNVALAEVADLYDEVSYVGVLASDFAEPVDAPPTLSVVATTLILNALAGGSTSRNIDALAYIEHPVPGAEVTLTGLGSIMAGTDSATAPTVGLRLVVENDPTAPGTARVRSMVPIAKAWGYDGSVDESTGVALTAPLEIGLRRSGEAMLALVAGVAVYTYTTPPTGLLNAVQITSITSKFDMVSLGGEAITIRDYEGKPGVTYEYRLQVSNFNVELFSPQVSLGTVKTPAGGYWLKDPLYPSLNLRVQREEEDLSFSISEEQGVFDIPGRGRAIVVTGELKAPKVGAQVFSVATEADLTALLSILRSGRTVLFQSPRGRQWYMRFGPEVIVNSLADSYGRPLYQVTASEGAAVDPP